MASEKQGCLVALLRLLGIGRKRSPPVPPPQQTWAELFQNEAAPADPASPAKGVLVNPADMPYALQRALLSPSERAFYYALKKATNEEWIICPQVRLADVFFNTSKDFQWLAKIASKHVDFLLCEPETFRPVLGIELDDVSHRRPERLKRDAFVEQVFAIAKLPLIRVLVQRNYEVNALRERLDAVLATIPRRQRSPTPEQDPLAPLCPKCGAVMVRRVAERGERRGKAFYGCSNFPQCKGTFELA